MGILISRFRRKPTTYEVLEDIDKEITRLQRNRKANQDRQKKIVTSLLIYSIALYVLGAVVFFLLYFPETWKLRFIYSIPLLIFPVLIWGMKKLLHWYFVKRIASNDLALQELRERKKQILEDVMDTETYKKAREILEKFDPTRLRKLEGHPDSPSTSTMNVTPTPGSVLQQRTVRTVQQQPRPITPTTTPRLPRPPSPRIRQTPAPYPATPMSAPVQATPRAATPQTRPPAPGPTMIGGSMGMGPPYVVPPGPPMPRSVLPRDRGTMDRLMDYLVGDGPENRYALICRQCHSHNGMALKEEFEFLTFRCCYCFYVNPARKQRPTAPRLEFFAPQARGKGAQTASASNEESDDDDVDSGDDNSEDSDVDSRHSGGSSEPSAVKPTDSKPAPAPGESQTPSQTSVQDSGAQDRATLPPKPGATSLPRPTPRSIPKPQSSSAESQSGVQGTQSTPAGSQKQAPAQENTKSAEKPVEAVKPAESGKEIPIVEKKHVSSLPLPSAGATSNVSARSSAETNKTSNFPQDQGNVNNNSSQANGAVDVKGDKSVDTDKPGHRAGTCIPAGVTGIPVAGRGIPVRSAAIAQQAIKPGAGSAVVTKPSGDKESPSVSEKETAP